MFDSLSTRLQTVFDRLGGRGRLTEENIQEALREVRVALLEADVNFKVVREFIERVRVRAIGQDVLTSLTPAQQVVKVVHGELVELLGGSGHRLSPAAHPPTIVMLIGLQGSGKTTTAATLARPVAFVGRGGKTDALEPFHPDRVASRILGMGDVLSLVEKAQEAVDQKKAEELVRKLREDAFTLDDFREQLKQLRSMGPLDQNLGMLPFAKMLRGPPSALDAEQADIGRSDAIIRSRTPDERRR